MIQIFFIILLIIYLVSVIGCCIFFKDIVEEWEEEDSASIMNPEFVGWFIALVPYMNTRAFIDCMKVWITMKYVKFVIWKLKRKNPNVKKALEEHGL